MRNVKILIVVSILLNSAFIGYIGFVAGSKENYVGYQQALKEAGISEADYENCMRWAFGDKYLSVPLSSMFDVWSKRHPKLSIVYSSDTPHKAIYKIGKAWITKQEQN